jgi:hypothetical protein
MGGWGDRDIVNSLRPARGLGVVRAQSELSASLWRGPYSEKKYGKGSLTEQTDNLVKGGSLYTAHVGVGPGVHCSVQITYVKG